MFSSTTTRAKTSLSTDVISYNVCFSIVFSPSWCCPCILKYCSKQENFTQWFNNTFFLAPIPACNVSRSLLPQQSGRLCNETHQIPDPVKKQTTNPQKVQMEGVFPSQLAEIFLNLTLQTVKCLQKMDWQGMAQMQRWMAQARADSASTAANDTALADGAKKKLFYRVHIHAQALWMDYTCWSINHLQTPGCLWNQALCYLWTRNKTDAASTAHNANKQATIYPCNPQTNYF